MSKKLDIFQVLKNIDNKNYNFTDHLSDNETKELNKNINYIIPIWFNNIENNKEHINNIIKFNEFNDIWFALSKHPELQYKLLCSIGNKKFNKRFFINKKSDIDRLKNDIFTNIVYDISKEEVIQWINILNLEAFREILNRLGLQESQQKEYVKIFEKVKCQS